MSSSSQPDAAAAESIAHFLARHRVEKPTAEELRDLARLSEAAEHKAALLSQVCRWRVVSAYADLYLCASLTSLCHTYYPMSTPRLPAGRLST